MASSALCDSFLKNAADGAPRAFPPLVAPPGSARGPNGAPPPLSPEDQAALARRYGETFAVFMKNRASIVRVTLWGLRDTDSWRRPLSPLLFDDTYARKPAYDAVIAAAKKTGP